MSIVRDTPLYTHLGIVNSHDVARRGADLGGGPAVYIEYRAQQSGRASTSPAWQVIEVDGESDPNGRWYNYGHKTFLVSRSGSRAAALEAAKAWATKRYGVEWAKVKHVRNVWFTQPAADAVNKALRDAERAAR